MSDACLLFFINLLLLFIIGNDGVVKNYRNTSLEFDEHWHREFSHLRQWRHFFKMRAARSSFASIAAPSNSSSNENDGFTQSTTFCPLLLCFQYTFQLQTSTATNQKQCSRNISAYIKIKAWLVNKKPRSIK